jgi:hypothetical protein
MPEGSTKCAAAGPLSAMEPAGWDDWLTVAEPGFTADDVVAVATVVVAARAVTAATASRER